MDNYNLLVVEDDMTNSILLKRILIKAGYSVTIANNGIQALNILDKNKFDAVLTDWMMPNLDGIELIKMMRDRLSELPYIIMITALHSDGAMNYALDSGADDYISKPFNVGELLILLKEGILRNNQDIPVKEENKNRIEAIIPPFVGVVIAASTGGPPTLIELFKNLERVNTAAFYIVQHGPAWMLDKFAGTIQNSTNLNVIHGQDDMTSSPGNIYIAPGDLHMKIQKKTMNIILDNGAKENFVRPSADPLFRSAASSFGRYMLAVVLTGLGRDGVIGASIVEQQGGKILVQNPDTAMAPSMPRSVIEAGIPHQLVNISDMPNVLLQSISKINEELKRAK